MGGPSLVVTFNISTEKDIRMSQTTVKFDEANRDQLIMFAAQSLGMQFAPNIGEAALKAKIRAAYEKDEFVIMTPDDDVVVMDEGDIPAAAHVETDAEFGGGNPNPFVKITLATQEGTGGERPVFVGVNGIAMLVPRGKPVDIPYRYYLALTYAVKSVHVQRADGEIQANEVPAYPFNVNAMPSQIDIDAFFAKEATS